MGCLSPLIAINRINENGVVAPRVVGQVTSNTPLEYFRSVYGEDLVMLPCNKCVNCNRENSRIWQLRIMCESMYFEHTYFITLTYKKNPPKKPLKVDFDSFIKSVRNRFGNGVKFFGCGEVGCNTHRSHYHVILFLPSEIPDLTIFSKRGLNYVYGSKLIESLWNKGFIEVGELSLESAGYVSRYSQKKRLFCDDGEFIKMSRGLGKSYVLDNLDTILDSDFIYINGNRFKIPRYFLDKVLENASPDICAKVDAYKIRKRNTALTFRYNLNRSLEENSARVVIKSNEEDKVLRKEVYLRDVY